MTNIRPTEELIVHFDRHVSYGLWRSVLNKTVDEADRLGFDLSKEDGGLEDPLSALHQFSVVICRARLEYLSPFRKGSYYQKSLQDALLDGWADRLRDDVLSAWRQALEKQAPLSLPEPESQPPTLAELKSRSNRFFWICISTVMLFALALTARHNHGKPYHDAYSQLIQWWQGTR